MDSKKNNKKVGITSVAFKNIHTRNDRTQRIEKDYLKYSEN